METSAAVILPIFAFASFPLPCSAVIQNLIHSLDRLHDDARGGAVSIGNFDGVHRGHAGLVRRLCAAAARLAGPSVVITFDPHPAAILRPESSLPRLTTLERRAELLRGLGVDFVVVCHVDEAFLNHTAEQFFRTTIVEAMQARAVVEGPNFFFGRGREGDIPRLQQLCDAASIELEVVSPCEDAQQMISSSRIRKLLQGGQVGPANALLTAPYQVTGCVARGAQRGAGLGFPTANLHQVRNMLPGHGVYAGQVVIDGQSYAAAVHIGSNPTFGDDSEKVEVHILRFSGDLYGRSLSVDFLQRVRDIAQFASVPELKQQLQRDVAQVESLVAASASSARKD